MRAREDKVKQFPSSLSYDSSPCLLLRVLIFPIMRDYPSLRKTSFFSSPIGSLWYLADPRAYLGKESPYLSLSFVPSLFASYTAR